GPPDPSRPVGPARARGARRRSLLHERRARGGRRGDRTSRDGPVRGVEVAGYRIRCYPLANAFERGHRIRLDVTSSSFPRFSRNLNNGEDVGTSTRIEVARQTILHTDVYPSHVLLPI